MAVTRVRIGMCIDDLRMPAQEAIRQAARMGYQMIQIGTAGTEFDGLRFGDPARLDEAVERTSAAIEMAARMHVPIVAVELGPIAPDSGQIVEALRLLARSADVTGTFLALQTGHIDPKDMAQLIRSLGGASIKACYDPAGLLLGGFEALSGIGPLADQIILAYARDAIGGRGGGRVTPGRETALGEGEVDLAGYAAALQEANYFGPQVVRRMQASNPLADLGRARQAMESLGR